MSPVWKKIGIRLGISMAFGSLFLWIMQAGAMPLVPDAEMLESVTWWGVPVYGLMWCCVHVLRAARWQLLLRPIVTIPMGRVIAISFLGYLAILALPLRTGEFIRPLLIRRQGKISGWAAAGTIGAERLVDGFVLSLLLFVALQWSSPLDPLPNSIGQLPIAVSVVPRGAYLALTVFAAALVFTVAFFLWKKPVQRLIEGTLGMASPGLGKWVSQRADGISEGLRFLTRPRDSVPFVVLTFAYWLLNAASSWVLALALGFEDFTLFQGCVVTGVLALGILVPSAPGFFGSFQVSLYAGLAMFYSSEMVLGRGAAFVFYMYLGQLGVTVGFALIAGLLAPDTWRGAFRRSVPAIRDNTLQQ